MADQGEFAGRVALVTAAAGRGIGQAVARRLAAGGASVVVTDIHPGRTQKVTAAIAADYPAATVAGYPMDAGDRDQIDQVLNAVTASLGPVQILVCTQVEVHNVMNGDDSKMNVRATVARPRTH